MCEYEIYVIEFIYSSYIHSFSAKTKKIIKQGQRKWVKLFRCCCLAECWNVVAGYDCNWLYVCLSACLQLPSQHCWLSEINHRDKTEMFGREAPENSTTAATTLLLLLQQKLTVIGSKMLKTARRRSCCTTRYGVQVAVQENVPWWQHLQHFQTAKRKKFFYIYF